MVDPFWAREPTAGAVRVTWPVGIVAEYSFAWTTTNPAAVKVACAWSYVPDTCGIGIGGGPLEITIVTVDPYGTLCGFVVVPSE